MNILHVINDLETAGAQKVVLDLACSTKESGHDVQIGVLVYGETPFTKMAKDMGIEVIPISTSNNRNDYHHVFNLKKLMKKYEIVHSHLFPAQYFVAAAKCLDRSLPPIITTEHNTTNRRRGKIPYKWIDKFIYKQYDSIINCSEEAKTSFSRSFPSLSSGCIANGVNIKKIANSEPYSKKDIIDFGDNEAILIGMIARFQYPKRQDIVVESLANLPDNFHALFIGDGQTRPEVEALAKRLNVYDRCHFLGIRQDVGKILRTCDITCLISEHEGLSLSSIECMAAGKPFIGSRVSGITGITEGYGILINNDSNILAETVTELVKDNRMEEVGKRCQERAADFSLDKCAKKYLEVYAALLNKNSH